jgi:hypothetical protein
MENLFSIQSTVSIFEIASNNLFKKVEEINSNLNLNFMEPGSCEILGSDGRPFRPQQ